MTAKQVTILTCNGPKCTDPGDPHLPFLAPRIGGGPISTIRKLAAEAGWKHENGQDFCPVCQLIMADPTLAEFAAA